MGIRNIFYGNGRNTPKYPNTKELFRIICLLDEYGPLFLNNISIFCGFTSNSQNFKTKNGISFLMNLGVIERIPYTSSRYKYTLNKEFKEKWRRNIM